MNSTKNELIECYNDLIFKSKNSKFNYNIINSYEIKSTNKMNNEIKLNDNFNCMLNMVNSIDNKNNISNEKSEITVKSYMYNSDNNTMPNLNNNLNYIKSNNNVNIDLINDMNHNINDNSNNTINDNENATFQNNYTSRNNELNIYKNGGLNKDNLSDNCYLNNKNNQIINDITDDNILNKINSKSNEMSNLCNNNNMNKALNDNDNNEFNLKDDNKKIGNMKYSMLSKENTTDENGNKKNDIYNNNNNNDSNNNNDNNKDNNDSNNNKDNNDSNNNKDNNNGDNNNNNGDNNSNSNNNDNNKDNNDSNNNKDNNDSNNNKDNNDSNNNKDNNNSNNNNNGDKNNNNNNNDDDDKKNNNSNINNEITCNNLINNNSSNINMSDEHINNISKSNFINNTDLNNEDKENENNKDRNINYEKEKTNEFEKMFLKNLDEIRSFERGVLHLTEEEFTFISKTINSLGFRFIEISIEKPKNEKRNTYSSISKRHLNEIKNLRCSLSNNIYDAGKRKSKKSFDMYYSKEELSSKENDTQKDTKNISNEDNRKCNTKEHNYINEKNNSAQKYTKSGVGGNVRSYEHEKTYNKNIKKNEMDNKNGKNSYGSISNSGAGNISKCSSKKEDGKEMQKKRQRNNSLHHDNLNEEHEQHNKIYKKRNYKTKNPWKNYCFKILHKLKRKESSCWFLKPVNPELDGVPNYLNVITYPMDFETIEKKLLNNKYDNPFEWQQDVRQIFFNAFTYHKVKNDVWNDAYKLAKEFDKLLKESSEMEKILNEYTKNTNCIYLDMKQYNEILNDKYDYYDGNNSSANSSSISSNSSDDMSSDNYNYHKSDSKNYGKKNNAMGSSLNNVNSSQIYSQQNKNKNKKGEKINKTNKVSANMLKNAYENNRGKKENSTDDIDFDPPSMGTIPDPPGIQKIGINDKGLNNYQVKLLFKNLRRLAPNQRRAALEIIQDDLGILAENHMFDRYFTFDTDLLSIEKQKRIFLYINHMGRINLEQYKASLISSEQIPNFNLGKGKISGKNIGDKNYLKNNTHYDKHRSRYSSSSSNSSDSSSSNSSDSSSYSTSSDETESESDSDIDSDSYDKKKVKRHFSNERKKEMSNRFFEGNRRKSLPQYKPVDENKKNLEIREDVMGMHADFLASMDTPKNQKKNLKNSESAWPEWKGQVIQQAILTQHQTNVPINKKELIAEGYDAKI
ncbi:bromodomain protein, putative [Plasmodium relictum]|uniref:Bromodomain protein, putative n=1 Tax=Plasmodium relictum TaxID=85471 RepID=A0A1J1HC78_PLARL|nr:bromodomain protein, putative [Plasmodium relictum]CRH02560.1 bromodomain protein, putative [Plasmodium relictum]